MAKNKKDTAKSTSATKAGRGRSGEARGGGGRFTGKGGGSSVSRSANTGRFVSKTVAPEKNQTGNPYAGLTKLVGKVRVRDPYTSESW